MKINNDEIIALEEITDYREFDYEGCDNCYNGGADVYEFKAHIKDFRDHYEVKLCNECRCAYFNGDPLPDNCNNIHNL